jgi:DNA repair exonuclease SbcCD nuclease subunit
MKLAHISDLHLRHHLAGTASIPTRHSREMPELFAEAVRRICDEAPDLLIVTGDLVDYPLDAMNDADVQRQGEADLRLIADILQAVDCPVALVHGNHDHPELVQRVFGHLPAVQHIADHQVVCFFDDEDNDHHPRRLGASQQRFLGVLADADSPPQIHVQHYVVWPQHNEDYPHTYWEGEWLRDQIVESGRVRLVLSGHFHTGITLFQIGQTYFAGVPAFTEHPHPYWIYTIEDGKVTCRKHQLREE